MAKVTYNKSFKIKVAKEALLPENEGLERVIARKSGLLPGTVVCWKEHYREYGDDAFWKGYSKRDVKSPREKELEKKVSGFEEEVKVLKKAAAFLANVKHE